MTQKAIDVSNNNGRIEWRKVREAGYRHAFAKASEGETFLDPQVDRNAKLAREQGIALSLYHFGHPSESPKRNAEHFLRVIVPLVKVGDPIPVLDLEVSENHSWEQLWEWQRHFGELVGEALGCSPMLYSSAYWLDRLPFPEHHRPLWGASWGHATQAELDRWHVWQYSAAGRVPGIRGLVDLDSILRPLPTIGRKP